MAVVKNLHRAEFWGKFFAKGWKGREASWAGVWVPLGRCQLLALNPSSSQAKLPSVGAGSGRGRTPAGAACARRPLARPSAQGRAAQDKGSGGSCLDRLARGGHGHPECQPPPPPGGGGPAPAFVCATAEGRVRRKRAPSCGRSWALHTRRRGATFARPEPPSLAGILAGPAVSSRRRLLQRLACVLLGVLCVR